MLQPQEEANGDWSLANRTNLAKEQTFHYLTHCVSRVRSHGRIRRMNTEEGQAATDAAEMNTTHKNKAPFS